MSDSVVYLPELREQLYIAATVERARHQRRTRRARAFAGATAAIVLAGAVALGAGSVGDQQAIANPVRSDGTLLNIRFSVFDRPSDSRQPGNPFSSTAVPRLLAPFRPDERLKVDPNSVHRLVGPRPDLWVAADPLKVCISAAARTGQGAIRVACARPAQILEDGLFLWGRSALGSEAGAEVVGLLPDGVPVVTIDLANGESVVAHVTDNGLAVSVPSPPSRVRYPDESGARHSAQL